MTRRRDDSRTRPGKITVLLAGAVGCSGTIDEATHTAYLDAASAAHVDASHDAGLTDGTITDPQPSDDGDSGPLHVADARVETGGDAAADAASVVEAGAASPCGDSSYLLCEDFESAAAGALPAGWTVAMGWGGGSAPVVVDDVHHSGARALRTGVASTGQSRVEHSLASLGDAANEHWGRVYYRAKSGVQPPAGGVLHNTLVALRGNDESRVVDTVINTQGAHQFLYNIPDDSFGKGSSYDFHSYDGAWHCAEWYVDADSASYRFFFDGAEVSSMAFSGQAAAHLGGVKSIVLGFIGYQMPPSAYDGWFDDLVLATSRVGCADDTP